MLYTRYTSRKGPPTLMVAMPPIVTLIRPAGSLAKRRSAMAVESSIPDAATPRSVSGMATRPVPMANSSASPSPADSASRSTVGPSTSGSNMGPPSY